MSWCNIGGYDKHDGDLWRGRSGRTPTYGAGQWTSTGLFRALLARLRARLFSFTIALNKKYLFCICFLESKFQDVPFWKSVLLSVVSMPAFYPANSNLGFPFGPSGILYMNILPPSSPSLMPIKGSFAEVTNSMSKFFPPQVGQVRFFPDNSISLRCFPAGSKITVTLTWARNRLDGLTISDQWFGKTYSLGWIRIRPSRYCHRYLLFSVFML